MDVSVLIVNYNTAGLIGRGIDTALEQIGVSTEVLVVDNASQDHSLDVLKDYTDRITLIENQDNVGFGRANNQMAKQSQGEFLFLLNPDAWLTGTNDLSNLLAHLSGQPGCGLVGPRIVEHRSGLESPAKYRYPGEEKKSPVFTGLPGDIAWLMGAGLLIPADVYRQLGGFDEDYFLYGEEVDLCLRLRKSGYRIEQRSDVELRHWRGASERGTSSYEFWRKRQRGLHTFLRKHYDATQVRSIVSKNLRNARMRRWREQLRARLGANHSIERWCAVIDSSRELLRDS